EEAIKHMKLASGLKVNLFTSEKQFPDLAKPVQMAFDPQGRLWVAVWPSYPHWKPKDEMNDKLLVLEDTDGDGKADKCTVFANPHGHVFDRWGEDFVMDGTGAEPYIGACFSGKTYFPQRHKRAPKLYDQRTRPCPGMEILSSRQFPDSMQGNLLVPNVIGFLGILQYKIADTNAGFFGTEVQPN